MRCCHKAFRDGKQQVVFRILIKRVKLKKLELVVITGIVLELIELYNNVWDLRDATTFYLHHVIDVS